MNWLQPRGRVFAQFLTFPMRWLHTQWTLLMAGILVVLMLMLKLLLMLFILILMLMLTFPTQWLHTQYTLLVAGIFYDADAGVDASHAGADADVDAAAFSPHDIYIITWQSLDLPGSHLREIDF